MHSFWAPALKIRCGGALSERVQAYGCSKEGNKHDLAVLGGCQTRFCVGGIRNVQKSRQGEEKVTGSSLLQDLGLGVPDVPATSSEQDEQNLDLRAAKTVEQVNIAESGVAPSAEPERENSAPIAAPASSGSLPLDPSHEAALRSLQPSAGASASQAGAEEDRRGLSRESTEGHEPPSWCWHQACSRCGD